MKPTVNSSSLANALRKHCQLNRNQKTVAKFLDVSIRQLNRWLKGHTLIPTKHHEKIQEYLALKGELLPTNTQVWLSSLQYQDNLEQGLKKLAEIDPLGANLPVFDTEILSGIAVDSPFGQASSPLTNDEHWAYEQFRLGSSIVCTKTQRLGAEGEAFRAYTPPNIRQVTKFTEPLEPDELRRKTEFFLASDEIAEVTDNYINPATVTLVNRFGIPSVEKDKWLRALRNLCSYRKPGQAVIASFTGHGQSKEAFIGNAVQCGKLMASCGPDAIELNMFYEPAILGVGNCKPSPAEQVFGNPQLTGRLVKELRLALTEQGYPKMPVLLKINDMPTDELRNFVSKTQQFVDGYTAINAIPKNFYVEVGSSHEPEFSPLFIAPDGKATAAISGVAISAAAIQSVQNLAAIRQSGDGSKPYNYKIFGAGGATDASSAVRLLKAGADAVLTCSGSMINPLLCAESRLRLRDSGYISEKQSAENSRKLAEGYRRTIAPEVLTVFRKRLEVRNIALNSDQVSHVLINAHIKYMSEPNSSRRHRDKLKTVIDALTDEVLKE